MVCVVFVCLFCVFVLRWCLVGFCVDGGEMSGWAWCRRFAWRDRTNRAVAPASLHTTTTNTWVIVLAFFEDIQDQPDGQAHSDKAAETRCLWCQPNSHKAVWLFRVPFPSPTDRVFDHVHQGRYYRGRNNWFFANFLGRKTHPEKSVGPIGTTPLVLV